MTATATDFFFHNMGRYEMLEHEQICKLSVIVQAWQQHSDGPDNAPTLVRLRGKAARDKIVRHNLRLIVHIWKKNYATRLPNNHPGLPDAFQGAAVDLTRAAEKYVASKSKFSTYAATWIHKGMKSYLAGEDRLVRIPLNNVHMIKAAQALISRAKMEGRPVPTPEELVVEMAKTRRNVPRPEVLAEWLEAYHRTDAISYDSPVQGQEDEGMSLCDTITDERSLNTDDDVDALERAISFLGEQEQHVISQRYYARKPPTLKEIAPDLKVSESQVSVIEHRAIESLRNLAGVN